ncbi:MAG: hypothetical protein ACFFB2_18050 [Promethearchaeota archaeon]
MKTTRHEALFILGHKFGELSREIELVIETAEREEKRERHQIKVIRIYDSLRYIHDELKQLGVSEEIQRDLSLYLNTLAKNYSEIRNRIVEEEKQETETEMIVSKLKRRFQRKNLDLKPNEVADLSVKLKIWKDKMILELLKS